MKNCHESCFANRERHLFAHTDFSHEVGMRKTWRPPSLSAGYRVAGLFDILACTWVISLVLRTLKGAEHASSSPTSQSIAIRY